VTDPRGKVLDRLKRRLTDVVAEREYRLAIRGRKRAKVRVRFGKPRPDPDGSFYYCDFQIEGLAEAEGTRAAGGVDSVQALQLGMEMAATMLLCTGAYRRRELTWEGMFDLGLPVSESVRDLVHVDPRAVRLAEKIRSELEGDARSRKRRPRRGSQ
jgi:hypothetical protein